MTGSQVNRIDAIDAFRGLAIAGMILVNTPGSWAHVHPLLQHAEWNGISGADLVFPFFLFISGTAMFFSLRKHGAGLSSRFLKKMLVRVAVIFAAGVFLNAFPFRQSISDIRIMGVLQRIALAWGIASILCMYLRRRDLIIISVCILIAYWIILSSTGDFSLWNNAVRAVDLRVLGEGHLWTGRGIPFDPEGLLSTVPAAVTVITGYLSGSVIVNSGRTSRMLLVSGVISAVLGIVWSPFQPINKSLWTGSYVLLTSGTAGIVLALFYFVTEIRGWDKQVMPLKVFGRNPLLLYLLSSLWVQTMVYLVRFSNQEGEQITAYSWIYRELIVPAAGETFGSLLFSLLHLLLFWLILYPLYRRKIFVSV